MITAESNNGINARVWGAMMGNKNIEICVRQTKTRLKLDWQEAWAMVLKAIDDNEIDAIIYSTSWINYYNVQDKYEDFWKEKLKDQWKLADRGQLIIVPNWLETIELSEHQFDNWLKSKNFTKKGKIKEKTGPKSTEESVINCLNELSLNPEYKPRFRSFSKAFSIIIQCLEAKKIKSPNNEIGFSQSTINRHYVKWRKSILRQP